MLYNIYTNNDYYKSYKIQKNSNNNNNLQKDLICLFIIHIVQSSRMSV